MILNPVLLPSPEPTEQSIQERFASEAHRRIYQFLFDRRDDPPTMVEVIEDSRSQAGVDRSQTGRRLRDLRENFLVVTVRHGSHYSYVLKGMWEVPRTRRTTLSGRIKSEVLIQQRCAQCGKTPSEDFVKLQVDHKLPLAWGGDNSVENLQALCVECNHGKRDYFATMDTFADQIKHASQETETHRRIGELMKAFQSAGVELPAEVLSVVASIGQYQDDWQKRARELRVLGWRFKIRRTYRDGRVRSLYKLESFEPWPETGVRLEIKRREIERRKRQ